MRRLPSGRPQDGSQLAKSGRLIQMFGLRRAPAPRATVSPDAHVTPDPTRCVQCGACGYNCPVGIPVRDFARQGRIVDDPRCVQCGQCIAVCPRGTLSWSTPGDKFRDVASEAEYAELMRLFVGPSQIDP